MTETNATDLRDRSEDGLLSAECFGVWMDIVRTRSGRREMNLLEFERYEAELLWQIR